MEIIWGNTVSKSLEGLEADVGIRGRGSRGRLLLTVVIIKYSYLF